MITYLKEAQIRLNYTVALNQATDLESVANTLERSVCDTMNQTMEQLSASWKGESANRFIGKEDELEQQIIETARQLRETARAVRTVAKTIYKTEMRNVQIARAMMMGL